PYRVFPQIHHHRLQHPAGRSRLRPATAMDRSSPLVRRIPRGATGMTLQPPPTETSLLHSHYRNVRDHSMQLVEGLSAEDCQLQSMAEASPIKWHLAHTTWFFETFIL